MKVTLVKEFGTNELFAAFTNDDNPLFVGSTQMGKDWADWANSSSLDHDSIQGALPVNMFLDGPREVSEELVNLFNFKPLVKSEALQEYYDWIDSRIDGFATKALFGGARRRLGQATRGARSSLGARSVRRRRRGSGGDLGPSLRPNKPPAGMMAFDNDGDGDGWTDEDDPEKRRYVGYQPISTGSRENNQRWARPRAGRGSDALRPVAMRFGGRQPTQRSRTGWFQRMRDRIGEAIDVSRTPRTPVSTTGSRRVRRNLRDISDIAIPDVFTGDELDEEELTEEDVQLIKAKMAEYVGKPGELVDDPKHGKKNGPGFHQRDKSNDTDLSTDLTVGYNLPVEVPVGANGIDTVDKAIEAVANGAPLSQIPDDFLGISVMENSTKAKFNSPRSPRFKISGTGAHNVNDMKIVTDEVTGARFGLKFFSDWKPDGEVTVFSVFTDEDVNEVIGAHVAERIGAVQGQMRFASPVHEQVKDREEGGPTRAIMFELGQSVVGDPNMDNYSNKRGQLGAAPLANRVGMTILDYLLLNTDRHGENFLFGESRIDGGRDMAVDQNGNRILDRNGNPLVNGLHYPIDHGVAVGGRGPGFPIPQKFLDGPIEDVLGEWVGLGASRYPELPIGESEIELTFAISAIQARLRKLESEMPILEAINYASVQSGKKWIWQDLVDLNTRLQMFINADAQVLARAISRGR